MAGMAAPLSSCRVPEPAPDEPAPASSGSAVMTERDAPIDGSLNARSEVLVWLSRGIGLSLGVAVVVGILFIAGHATNVILLLFIGILLASALEPFVGWSRSHTPVGRGATILVVYASFLTLVVGLVVIVVPAALSQADELSKTFPPFLDRTRDWAAGLQPSAASTTVTALVDAARDLFKPAAPPAPGDVVQASLTVAEVVGSIATLLALVFFWLIEHARLQRYALAFVPANRRQGWREAWNEIETRLGLWVRGQLTLMLTIGVATGIAYTLLGVPSALLLALFAGIAEAIPIIGPAIGAVPAVVIAATVSPQLAIVVLVVYVILQFVEGNVLVPIVMRNSIGLSPFIVLVALLIGGAAGGIVGAFIAVPVAAAIEVFLQRMQARDVPVSQEPGSANADESTRQEDETLAPDSAVGRASH